MTLKLEVARAPVKDRSHVQDVAEVLEEILTAADKGLNVLPPRLNRLPGQIWNDAKQKTAYEISACLVGSEMCIRDRGCIGV